MELTNGESEILILKASLESIDSMINNEVLYVTHNNPYSEVRFNSSTHQHFFNIILLDFLKTRIFGIDKPCLETLEMVCRSPVYNSDTTSLKNAVNNFVVWLNEHVEFEHNGQTGQLWFPSID